MSSSALPTTVERALHVLNTILPILRIAKASVMGIGIPGVEGAINGVFELATMTMEGNKDDLSKLEDLLNSLIALDPLGASDDLGDRLLKLSANLKVISSECKLLRSKNLFKRFLKSKEYKERIQGVRGLIAYHIQEFTFHSNISIERSVEKITLKVDEALVKAVLASVKCVPARYNAENTPNKCMDGTRVKIIKDIVTRLTAPPNPSERIVMLSGVAGSGKSTITKSVASILADKGMLAASFFFSRDYAERKEIKHIPSTLASQLADYNPTFRYLLVKFLDEDRTGILSAEPWLQFQKLVVELLAQLPPSTTVWIICLDALDECGKDRGQIFLRWVSDSITQIPPYIRFFLAGRPDVPSYLRFDTLQSVMHGIILDQIDPATINHDLHLYVERSLDGSTWTTKNPWKIQPSDVDEITKHAAGLFIFAATAVRYVLSGLPQTRPQKSIRHLLAGAPLTHLHDLYQLIVNEAILVPGPDDARSQEAHDCAIRVLGTILFLLEPLGLVDLATLLKMDVEDLTHILLPLSAVIHIPDAGKGVIQIIHLSFREFMILHVHKSRMDLLCTEESQQCALALDCLEAMRKELRFNICDCPTSYLRNNDMPDLKLRLNTHIPGHLRYACRFWGDHLSATTYTSNCAEVVSRFLLDKFLFWLEILSFLGMVTYAHRALSKLIAWLDKDSQTVHFAKDAKRFIAFFAEAITQSAPHIYISALALAPSHSQIGQRFRPQFPHLLGIRKGEMINWPMTVAVLEGHTNLEQSVTFSPDSRHIASGSWDRTICVWDAESGDMVGQPLVGHTDRVQSIAFSPDGRHIVSGSSDRTVRVWDAESGEMVGQPFEGHTDSVTSVAFSPDGRHLVSGSSDRTVCVWDAESGEMIGPPFEGHTDWVRSVAFSSDGKHIVSGSDDHTMCVWDIESGYMVGQPFEGHTDCVLSVAFSPDGRHIVSGSRDHTVRVWDTETREMFGQPFEGHTEWVRSVAFSPNGRHIMSGSDDRTVRMWDLEDGDMVGQPFKGHTDRVLSVAFSPDGGRIVSGSQDQTVCVWDTESEEMVGQPFEGHTDQVQSVAFSPDGRHIASGSWDRTIRVWDAESGDMVSQPLVGHADRVQSIAFSPDGRHIVSGSDDHVVHVWDIKSGEMVGKPFEGHTDGVQSIAFSPDGRHIVSGSHDKTVCLWDTETGDMVGQPFEGHIDCVQSVAFSPDGKHIVSGSRDQTVRVWDTETGEMFGQPFEGHTDWVRSVAFSSDGRHIVSGSDDHTVCVWDIENGEMVGKPFKGHTDRVQSIALSPDGRHMVSGSSDRTVRVWDAERGEMIGQPFEGHTDWVRSVAFSPDARHIVSGSDDHTMRVWDIASGDMVGHPFEGHTDSVESVALHPDGSHIAFGSHDRTDKKQSVSLSNKVSLHNQPSCSLAWQINHGWVSCHSDLLFWLPSNHRVGFWMPHDTLVIGRQQTSLSYDTFVHGTDWAKCYIPLVNTE